MESFIDWLFMSFYNLFFTLINGTVNFIYDLFGEANMDGMFLDDYPINLVLFSETPILSMHLSGFLVLFFTLFYTIIFIVIVWKIIKKVVVKITGWNRW